MLKVGITGGIGSGKTLVCKVFETLEIPVFNADNEAKKIMNSNSLLQEVLLNEFGEETFNDNGNINNKYFSKIVFENKEKLEKLNSIVHPFVIGTFDEWAKKQESKIVILESAIIFENGLNTLFDKIITIISPIEIRIERILKRGNSNKDDILKIISNQLSDEEKIKLSDFVIYNNEESSIISQVTEIINKLS